MEFIEEFDTAIGLWADGNIVKAIHSRSTEDVYEFSETLALIAKYHFQPSTKPNENFSFIANSSLSGGNQPCSFAKCREKKLNELITFSALYADEVYIQNPFENVMLGGVGNIKEVDRQELVYGIGNYFYLKPLIEEGIIKYAQNEVSLCQHHHETIAKPLAVRIAEKEEQLYEAIHKILLHLSSVTFDIGKGAGPFLKISGPDNLIEHGEMYFHFYKPLPPFITSLLDKKLPYTLSRQEIIDSEVLRVIINPILRDLSNQEWHSVFYGTSYLCDNKTKMQIASKLNSGAYAASSLAFENSMQHYLPAIYCQDMKTITQLRKSEEEAFAVYRDKLRALIHKSKPWDEKEVASVFRDQLLPEINNIDKKIKDWKSKTKESLKEKMIFGTGAVSMGLYAGMLPMNIGEIIAAIGGGTAAVGAAMDYNKTLKEKEEARSNDFYFLWQVSQ